MKKIVYGIAVATILFSATSCNRETTCDTSNAAMSQKEAALNQKEMALNQREQALNARELAMTTPQANNMTTPTVTVADAKTPATRGYKSKKYAGNMPDHKMAAPHTMLTPGEYPEGSDRLLKEKDVVYLTPWGAKVMLNEIYARHGMTFKDEALRKHFGRIGWYHGTHHNVSKMLSSTEMQNVAFIKDHRKEIMATND